jgi:hypothetical protein
MCKVKSSGKWNCWANPGSKKGPMKRARLRLSNRRLNIPRAIVRSRRHAGDDQKKNQVFQVMFMIYSRAYTPIYKRLLWAAHLVTSLIVSSCHLCRTPSTSA